MPVFKLPGQGYSITPWENGSIHLVPTAGELRTSPNYGKIPVPTWDDVKRFFGERPRRPGELPEPPRRDRGGMYRTDAILDGIDEPAINDAYNLLLTDLTTDYRVRPRSLAKMIRAYGADRSGRFATGFEEGDVIELAYDVPLRERLRALAHEGGAKRLRRRNGYLNHPSEEEAVTAEGDNVLIEYINRALLMRN